MTYFGNQVNVTNLPDVTEHKIDSATEKISYRFTAQASKTVVKLYAVIGAVIAAHQVDLEVGLQADSGGEPDGTFLGSEVLSWLATDAGAETVTLTPSVTLVAGQVYHLVFSPTGTNDPDAANYIRLWDWGELSYFMPINENQDEDADQNYLLYDGVTWTAQDKQPGYVLEYSDGTYEGYGYNDNRGRDIYGDRYIGEVFESSSYRLVNTFGVVARRTAPMTTEILTVTVEKSDDDGTTWETVTSATFETSDFAITNAWVSTTMDLFAFSPGLLYRFKLTSTATVVSVFQIWGMREKTMDSDLFRKVIWGTTDYYSYDDVTPAGYADSDICFRFTEVTLTPYLMMQMAGGAMM